jgi:hypothetical protein
MGQEFAGANPARASRSSAWLDAPALLLQEEQERLSGLYAAQRKPFQEPPHNHQRLSQINPQRRLTTICAWCNKIRNGQGLWQRSQTRRACATVKLSHGICPECADRTYNLYREEKVSRNTAAPIIFNYSDPAILSGRHAVAAG